MHSAPESANGGGLLAIALLVAFITILATFGGFVDYVIQLLPVVR